MSSGADCQFEEVQPGVWNYRLQRWPYGDSNDYDAFGPFRSFSAARDHLDNNHQNPGGWMTTIHPTDHRHEWATEQGAYVPVGVEVTVRIESLGTDPSSDDILALLARGTLTADHLKVRKVEGYDPNVRVRACEACGKTQEAMAGR